MYNFFNFKIIIFILTYFFLNLLLIIFFPIESGDANTIKIIAENILLNSCISLSDPIGADCIPHWGSNQGLGYPLLVSITMYFFGENLNPIRYFQLFFHLLSILYLIYSLQKFSEKKINFIILVILH